MKIVAAVVAVVVCASLSAAIQPVDVNVTFDETFTGFKVYLSGVEWLRSGPVGIRDSGQWWASNNKDKYLLKAEKHFTGNGVDLFGVFVNTL